MLVSGLLVATLGCASSYLPDPRDVDPELVPDFPAGTKVSLVHAQPSEEVVLIGKLAMGSSVSGTMRDWTGQAIVALEETLEGKDVAVGADAGKSLDIAVTKAVVPPEDPSASRK